MVKFILASVTLFNLFFVSMAFPEVIDRVVAYVDSYAITLRDFEKVADKTKEKIPQIKNEEILNTMINRVLLLKKAKELFIEGKDEELINNYIELKIKSTIVISESEIRQYYEQNKTQFKDIPYASVRNEIEKYLFEKELNKKLKNYLEELKETSDIKIIFIP